MTPRTEKNMGGMALVGNGFYHGIYQLCSPPFGEDLFVFSNHLKQVKEKGSKSKNLEDSDGDIDPAGNISLAMTSATRHYDIYLPTNSCSIKRCMNV